MTDATILAISGVLVFAYLLDIVGRRVKLPSVVLLIGAGLVARHVLDSLGLHLRWIDPVVPILGTLGLILIVLEGALDLGVTRERIRLIVTSTAAALLGFLASLCGFVLLFQWMFGLTVTVALLAAIPFAVISSAVAIPSAKVLPAHPREFIVYESSLSDIIGVLVFYAWLAADGSVGKFALDLFGGGATSLIAAVAAALGLYYLIHQLVGHVRFLPLLAALVFLYALGKQFHLSPLILVLVCGLLLNNPHLLEWNARLRAWHNDDYEQTLKEFKGLVAELTFATKSFFFLLLGYWTDVNQMLAPAAWAVAGAGLVVIYVSRFAILKLLRQPDAAILVWVAPRGLITVLLFLSAAEGGRLDGFPFGAVMLVVLITATLTAFSHREPVVADAVAIEVPPVTAANPVAEPVRPKA
jgi:hypothetical protein